MIEQHYTEEALLSLLDTRDADAVLGDPHLAACDMCSDALDSYKDIAGLLCDKDVWDEDDAFDSEPAAETLSRIRAFADSTAREDAEAMALVDQLLELPTEWWAEEVRSDERYATAGVVRRLVAVAHEAVDSTPTQASALTSIAVDLVDQLDLAKYDGELLAMLRGRAWRERAYALYYLGSVDAAKSAVQKATDAFSSCTLADVDIARTRLLDSMILSQNEEYEAAVASARASADVFATYGLQERTRAARWAETNVLVTSGRYREAIERYRQLESELNSGSPAQLAGIIVNTAYCYREMGESDRALPQYQFALGIYEDLGNRPEAARVRWNIAETLATTGKLAEAEKRYRAVGAEFESYGMIRDAALVKLNLAETALAQRRFAEAESLCQSVMKYFETIEAPYTSKALAALSYLREAAAMRKASAAVAEAVRRYIGRLPQQPSLLFAPPPLP